MATFSGATTTSPVTALGHEEEAGGAHRLWPSPPALGRGKRHPRRRPPSTAARHPLPAPPYPGRGEVRGSKAVPAEPRPLRQRPRLADDDRAALLHRAISEERARQPRPRPEGKRILARRHRLPITGALLSGAGARPWSRSAASRSRDRRSPCRRLRIRLHGDRAPSRSGRVATLAYGQRRNPAQGKARGSATDIRQRPADSRRAAALRPWAAIPAVARPSHADAAR